LGSPPNAAREVCATARKRRQHVKPGGTRGIFVARETRTGVDARAYIP